MSHRERVLTLVGMPGSGKSEAVTHTESLGFTSVYFGGVTIREVQRRGLAVTPANEAIVRNDIRATEGQDAFARRIIEDIENHFSRGQMDIVAAGLCTPDEYELFEARFGRNVLFVAITAARHIRYNRLATRQKRPLTAEEAHARDVDQIQKLNIGASIALADYTIVNDGPREAFFAAIDAVLKTSDFMPNST